MRLDAFDFDLPDDRIALRPVQPRDNARLLVVQPDALPCLADHHVRDLPDLLRPGDVLVANNTLVIPARLTGLRVRDASAVRIDATLLQREKPDRWRAFLRPGRRVKAGERIRFVGTAQSPDSMLASLEAVIAEKGDDGQVLLDFALAGPALDEAIARIGHMPLPPYIASRRREDEADRSDYQTMFASAQGAVAAPTAGLHFTRDLIDRLAGRGIGLQTLTLHVGAGTFLPVKVDDVRDHRMHAEWGAIDAATAATLNEARAQGGRIVAIGTTSLRLLESAADPDGTIQPFAGETSIFITPGYRLRAVDVLMTNFHLPRSTLFMLVCAFSCTNVMQEAYRHAVATGYRFYSYGDASLLFRHDQGAMR